jgi:alkyl sulfatase BDS1-like metallo-beta-lactamase superfamily hydrolase
MPQRKNASSKQDANATATMSKAAPKGASAATKAKNAAVRQVLPFDNTEDFEDARKGLTAPLVNGGRVERAGGGPPIYDMGAYDFVEGSAPDTVNPSLWRQAQLLRIGGLVKICDRVYQVTGQDLSNMDVIEGDTGLILVDPLTSSETAKAALNLYFAHRRPKPVLAVIHTHSHVDHFGGVKGVITEEDVKAKRTRVIAPAGFTEEAVSENVMAGTAMSRRATYMYGSLLPRSPQGQVGAGLGLQPPLGGEVSFITPTDLITDPVQRMTIDGVRFVFMLAPHTEAPAEMLFHLPDFRVLCSAEDATHNLHNLYTLRGAKTRDAKAWAFYLNKTIELFGADSDVVFAQHHWPTWGQQRVVTFLERQRDMYKYLHDQTLRLANHGYTMLEIAEMLEIPDAIGKQWYNRGYYGSVSHDIKAVYNMYLGWFDGNPATLHQYPPVEASRRYVEAIGGAEAVLEKARASFDEGDYRWVVQLVNHVVLADPENHAARELQADSLEQLGYQSENGTWRNFYLTGAQELRNGVMQLPAPNAASPDTIAAMPTEMLLDYLAIRLNGPKAADADLRIELRFTDTKERYLLVVKYGVLNYFRDHKAAKPQTTVTVARATLNAILDGTTTAQDAIASGSLKIAGRAEALSEFIGLLDTFAFWFNIVTSNVTNKR